MARILIVDDEPFVRRTLRRALSKHDLVLADGGSNAVEILANSEPFDLILCDLMMPTVTGMDVYAYVRDNWPGRERNMIFLTGGVVTEEAEKFVAEITNRVLDKPFQYQELRDIVEAEVTDGQE